MADKKFNIPRGHRNDYLGMTIDFSYNEAVTFDMIPYIKQIFTAFPEKITGVSSTPAPDHLFNVRPPTEAKLLPENKLDFFLELDMTSKLLLHS